MTDYAELIRQLAEGSEPEQQNARSTLYRLDENAVTPLIDEFYAGVNEKTGLVILSVLIQIGGYEVRALLEELNDFGVPHTSWQAVIKTGLEQF